MKTMLFLPAENLLKKIEPSVFDICDPLPLPYGHRRSK